ncbi:MAG: amidohydrolase family protein [Balneolaceae bacterium]|nr:amidohydrolase family protein [Balneolaceae bacterium]MBO6545600.1 amidohydrolase family protein [Balneolaceae bacterium]MBO6646996.1 amidohydrolase family protein [Balneolaceae bacterium]
MLKISLFVIPFLLYVLPFNFSTDEDCIYVKNTEETTAFTNVTVIPMTEEDKVLKNQTVVVVNDEISLISPSANVDLDEDIRKINGSGKFLIPGLAEMHGHVPPTHPPANAPSYFNDEYVENTLFLYVAAGITTVRGMLGYNHQLELKDKVNSGELIGPNLYLAGPSFNGGSVSSPEQAREKVIQQKEEGWDLLKIHPGLTLAEYNAMAETANEVGITFGGHVPSDVGIEQAIEAGQLTMDHLDGYVAYLSAFEGAERESKMSEIIQKTVEHDVWLVPTQALWETIIGAGDYEAMRNYDELKYIPQAVRNGYNNWVTNNVENNASLSVGEALDHAELRRELLQKMNEAGALILMGTDAPQLFSVPGFSIHRELPKMVEARMSPYEIIESGTRNVGLYFSDKDDFGTIKAGQRADLILVDSNPLENVANIQNHSGVMVQGRWYSKEMIDQKLAEIEASYN